jgi:hypothetical protein
MATRLESEARHFLELYGREFDSVDGARIARLYHAPCIAMRGDGSIHSFQSVDELTRFFQGVADTYRKDGYRSSRFSNSGGLRPPARAADGRRQLPFHSEPEQHEDQHRTLSQRSDN